MGFRLACTARLIILCSSLLTLGCHGFAQTSSSSTRGLTMQQSSTILFSSNHNDGERRYLLQQLSSTAAAAFTIPSLLTSDTAWAATTSSTSSSSDVVMKDDPNAMYAPKFVQEYEDFIKTPEGWSYRDVKPGNKGDSNVKAQLNDRVVYDWSGYTIGYFGRPFQAKGGPQGGAFDKELDYERTVLGSGAIVKGLECAMVGMSAGAVRQVVVPFEKDLSYPLNDLDHTRVGPKPSTFSGQRALNFVLENPRIDRTLLFNVKVIRVDKPNGSGGFVRG